ACDGRQLEVLRSCSSLRFVINATPTAEIYTLSLHDALPICHLDGRRGLPGELRRRRRLLAHLCGAARAGRRRPGRAARRRHSAADRKSTRLNSSHVKISYAVFCLKKKKTHR